MAFLEAEVMTREQLENALERLKEAEEENKKLKEEIACLKADRPKPFYRQLEEWLNGSCE